MKKTEIILLIVLAISVVLRFFVIPFSSLLFTLVSLILCNYYIFGSFLLFNGIRLRHAFKKSSYSDIRAKEIIISIFSGISIAYVILSLLFALNKWPRMGAIGSLLNGVIMSIICMVLSIIFYMNKSHPTYRRILWRLTPTIILCIILAFLI